MAIRGDWTTSEVLTSDDLNDTVNSKLSTSGGTATGEVVIAGTATGELLRLETPSTSGSAVLNLRLTTANQNLYLDPDEVVFNVEEKTPNLKFQVYGNSAAYGGGIDFYRYRGNRAAATAVQSGDNLGVTSIYGEAPGGGAVVCGRMQWHVDDTPATFYVPTRFTLSLMDNGGLEEVLKIDHEGVITGDGGFSLGAWTTFTTTVGGNGWAIGNATSACVYTTIGKVVHFRITLTWGTTTTFGSGCLTVTLPSTPKAAVSFVGQAHDTNLDKEYPVFCNSVGATTMFVRTMASPAADVTSTAPFTWASTDFLIINGSYELN